MKNIKNILFAFLIVMISSCENDKESIASAEGLNLKKDEAVISPTVIVDETSNSVFTKFSWDIANNGVSTVVKSYELVIFDHDNDPTLLNPVKYSDSALGLEITPETRNGQLTVKEFNDMVNDLKTFKCGQMNVDIRIKSTLGLSSNALVQYSNPITYAITAKPTSLGVLAFVKDSNATTASTEPKVLSSSNTSNTDYQGYMYLDAGSYKFYQPDACGNFTNATTFGGSDSTLSPSAASISVATAGHYYVTVDLVTNTYQLKPFRTVGIYGNGVRVGPGVTNATQLFYDSTTKKWSRELELVKGNKFSFKTNLWTGDEVVNTVNNNPPTIPASGTTNVSYLEADGDNKLKSSNSTSLIFGTIDVPGLYSLNARQKYEITVDLNSPRKYTYTLTLK